MAGRRTDDPTASAQTWGLDDQTRVWLGGLNDDAKAEVEPLLAGAQRPPEGPLDRAFVTPQSVEEALYFSGKLRSRMAPGGTVWIVYPKPSAPRAAEFVGSHDDLALGMFERGYVEWGTAAVGEHYTSAGFRIDQTINPLP